jgi:hypothetical protein
MGPIEFFRNAVFDSDEATSWVNVTAAGEDGVRPCPLCSASSR